MLDPEIPDERREQIALEARQRIESGGTLKHDTAWGMRKLAYEIRQRTEADYRLFRFETDGELLDELNHNLRIADGVLRFRIFKVDAGSPAIVPPPAMAVSSGAPARGPRRQQRTPPREAAAPAATDGEGPQPAEEASPGDATEEASPADAPQAEEAAPEPAPAETAEPGGEGADAQAAEAEAAASDEGAEASPKPGDAE
jgi:small subunit ribosomal protein S6